jgi:hypothetical protein
MNENLRMNYKKLFRQTLPLLIVAVTTYFFVKALTKNWHNVEEISLQPTYLNITSVLLFALAVVLSGLLWGGILNTLARDKKIQPKDAARIHCASWLLKYVPGQAGSILNKLAWGKKNGYSKKVITNSFIYENVLMVLAGTILSIPVIFLFTDQVEASRTLFLPLLVVVPMLIVTARPVFHFLLNTLLTLAKKDLFKEDDFLSTKQLLYFLSMYLFPRLLNGIGFILIAATIVAIPPSLYVGVAAAYILAGIVGLLAFFVPSGLGVREAVIVLLLTPYFGAEQAIVISLLARFYATIADGIIFGVYTVLNKGKLRQL